MTSEVVYNACYGGFNLSEDAIKLYKEKRISAGLPIDESESFVGSHSYFYGDRHNPHLVEVVKELGKAANDRDILIYK